MITLGIVLFNVVAGFLVGCRVASSLAWWWSVSGGERDHERYPRLYPKPQTIRSPDGDQWFGAAMFGLVAAATWPLTLILLLARGYLLAPPPGIRAKQQEERIRELEKELDLR